MTWTFWNGARPAWIQLCLDSMKENADVCVLDWGSWLLTYSCRDVSVETLRIQRPNVQSDFIRAHLLYYYGGLWIDADAIVFRDLNEIGDFICDYGDYEFVAYEAAGIRREICTALIAALPKTEIVAAYYWSMVDRLHENPNSQLPPIELGPRRLWDAVDVGRDKLNLIPSELVHPWPYWLMDGEMKDDLTADGSGEKYAHLIRDDAYCFMLTHRAIGRFSHADRRTILESNTLVGECFRRALHVSQLQS